MPRRYIVILLLIIVTAAVYWQVRAYDFVYFDDQEYVIDNKHVQDGLTMKDIKWAFTSTYASNWHPLTWISHMADRQLFGLSPAGPHLVNVLLHILNSVLLMLLLHKMTGGFWQSAFVAALFALHPLHVESVAWVAERKDVLSALFFLLAIMAYARYVKRPKLSGYIVSLSCFILGLMAKPMLVTLPFVLLLMDFWPLKRLDRSSFMWKEGQSTGKPIGSLVIEKIPFFLLALFSSVVTIIAQRNTIASVGNLPIAIRTGNAMTSYAGYLMRMIWPADLAVYYPLTLEYEPWKIACAVLLLIIISVWTIRQAGKRPYLLTGWLWYTGTLLPVIGIVQVGAQSMADRYTYIPLIGIFIMTAWGLAEVVSRWPHMRTALVSSALVLLMVLSGLTRAQAGYWKDTNTLFSRCLAVTKNNDVALGILGNYRVRQDRAAEGLTLLEQASALNDKDPGIQYNIGFALSKLGRDAEAEEHILSSVRLSPNNARAHNDLGIIIARRGDPLAAVKEFQEAVRLAPDNPDFRYELGVSLVDAGRLDAAIEQYTEVLREDPSYEKAHLNIGVALARQGNMSEAIKHFSRAIELNPADEDARQNLELARSMLNAADKKGP